MSESAITYYPPMRKALHVILSVIFLLCLLPAGTHAKVPCTGMRCHHDEMSAMQHSKRESFQDTLHGCCSGSPADPCTVEPVNRIDMPDGVLGSCRGNHHRTIHKTFGELDTDAQNQLTQGYVRGYLSEDKTVLIPVYLRTLSLRF
jgi:hypothetical protein